MLGLTASSLLPDGLVNEEMLELFVGSLHDSVMNSSIYSAAFSPRQT
jgi:hypothetical protein